VTGPGWSALAIAGVGTTVAGRDIRGETRTAFLVIAIAGYTFEAAWRAARGSYALRHADDRPHRLCAGPNSR